jgi:hypothetical protein
VELRAKRSLVWNEFPVAVDLACVFNTYSEFSLIVDEDITNVLFWKRKLSLWAFTLSSHVQCESFFRASGVAERGARVVIWTLWLEGDTAGDLSVWPDLSLKWLNCEDLILEKHWVIFDSFSDTLVLSGKSSDGLLLISLSLLHELVLIVGVIRVEAVLVFFNVTVLKESFFFSFLCAELRVKSALLLVFLFIGGESSPRKFDWNLRFVHDSVVLVRIKCDTCWIHVDVTFAEINVVIVRLSFDWYDGFKVVVRQNNFVFVNS